MKCLDSRKLLVHLLVTAILIIILFAVFYSNGGFKGFYPDQAKKTGLVTEKIEVEGEYNTNAYFAIGLIIVVGVVICCLKDRDLFRGDKTE